MADGEEDLPNSASDASSMRSRPAKSAYAVYAEGEGDQADVPIDEKVNMALDVLLPAEERWRG